jgi:DNA topoisomerase III
MQLILAEKPSVARDLARVLGVRPSGRGSFEGTGRVITWCVGHLVELDEPASYDARWKAWRLDTLPMLPARFKLRPVASSQDQLVEVRRLLADRRFTEVVNACDAGREGELIFRYVYDLAGSALPVRRLWISSMTDEAIRAGFNNLRPGGDYNHLADAARSRSEADWLVGLNATRAVTVRHRTGGDSPLYSIGRVQTPTLALVVTRDQAIRAFVPSKYWEVRGTFATAAGERFDALWTHQGGGASGPGDVRRDLAGKKITRLGAAALADQLLARLDARANPTLDPPVVESVRGRRTREPPPLLFDLTSLQRTANRRFGLSAARTLEIAQALYETHKILTYPRTDARHLSRDLAATMPKLFGSLAVLPEYQPHARKLLDQPGDFASNRRVFDDAKVQDHHAIIPTGKSVDLGALSRDERRVFDLVARRFLGVFFPDAEFAATEVVVRVGASSARPPDPAAAAGDDNPSAGDAKPGREPKDDPKDEPTLDVLPPPPDRFIARGRVRLVAGWQDVAGIGPGDASVEGGAGAPGAAAGTDGPVLPVLTEGARLDGKYASAAKETRPPPHLTEATLLAAMETAGRSIEDDELRAAMKDSGLGTPATRAATIETLIKRGFMIRAGKNLEATTTGMALIGALPVPSLASPELTGRWEARLSRIARGLEGRAGFMADIARYVEDVVAAVRAAPVNAVMAGTDAGAPARTSPRTSPPALAKSPAKTSAQAPTKARTQAPTKTATKARAPEPSSDSPGAPPPLPATLPCPRCRQGVLLTGKRGWGCSRWREGCGFVVWFDLEGKRLSPAQLRELVGKGKTRKTSWPQQGVPVPGWLVLDLAVPAGQGAVRFQPA